MKRFIFLALALALLLSGTQGATASSDDAYFASYIDKVGVMHTGQQLLTSQFFPLARLGAVDWYNYTLGTMQADGFVKASGTFSLALPPGTFTLNAVVFRKSDNAVITTYNLIETNSKVGSFSRVFFVDNTMYFYFAAAQSNTSPNPLTTSLLFEAIN
jgi:hypothetical protein